MEKPFVSLLVVLSLVCLGITSCTPKEVTVGQEPPKPEIKDSVTLSPKAQERFNISLVSVQAKANNHPVLTTGEIFADENKVFHINSLSNGRVVSDKVVLGDVIHAGQEMALVQNLDVAKIYGDYIHTTHQNEIDTQLEETRLALAKKNYDRLKTMFEEKIAAEKDFLKAEADYKISEQTVHGLKEHATHTREEAKVMLAAYGVKLGTPSADHIESNSPIIAPRAGVIIKKNVTVGDVVTNTEPLYVVADLSQVWLDIAIYDQQLITVKKGDLVAFTSDSLPGRTIEGRISYIKPSTEDGSGTFVARAVLLNPSLELKPGMLGQVEIHNQHLTAKPYLSENAVQKYGKDSFVFIAQGHDSFKRQDIELGDHVNGGYFINKGLAVGDSVVGNGSFTLKSEMLKSTQSGAQ